MAALPAMGRGDGSARGGRVVGDYMLGRQIGSGSFSVVWQARHRVRGSEVAVKEIVMERLSKKLQDSLLSEIFILKRINHPNIIGLHDIIEGSGRIYLVLEYCKGGDLSMYIQRHGRIPEATAKHFMRQLANGLQILRENNLIHRDLKPQNLLLSTNNEHSPLKIADFGFARSLQPRGLAETLCGSPLYMAPEIMQLQKYDAKADLWSVGAILYQLVTGRTPFTGNNQVQLLQNILKSTELRFPPDCDLSPDCINLCQKLLRRNPVERLTFEEFFNHPFLLLSSDVTLSVRGSPRSVESSPRRESPHDDCLPFVLDDISGGPEKTHSTATRKVLTKPIFGFSLDQVDKVNACSTSSNVDIHPLSGTKQKLDSLRPMEESCKLVNQNAETLDAADKSPDQISHKVPTVVDSLEFVDQDYVFVPCPPLDFSSSSVNLSWQRNSSCALENSPVLSPKVGPVTAPMPIIGAAAGNTRLVESLESHIPVGSGTPRSTDMADSMERPSAISSTRIRSLHYCASAISELVNEKIQVDGRLEAFSIQLVALAIWKQALHICHSQAASAKRGSPLSAATEREEYRKGAPLKQESINDENPDSTCQQIEREFLREVGRAEELARDIGQLDEAAEMPDAMEIIFQSALTLGRHGAVDEMMGHTERASLLYAKAVVLLRFLLVEAPALVLNPPFSLTASDCYRLRSYIDILRNRQVHSHSQTTAGLLKSEDRESV